MKAATILMFSLLIVLRVNGQSTGNDSVMNTKESEKIYELVEKPAEFPGGIEKLFRYLSKNTQYPKDAKKGITGKVYVAFVVNKDGSVDQESVKVIPFDDLQTEKLKATVIRDASFEHEAIRVVRSFPRWVPASHRGIAVSTRMILPIQFR